LCVKTTGKIVAQGGEFAQIKVDRDAQTLCINSHKVMAEPDSATVPFSGSASFKAFAQQALILPPSLASRLDRWREADQ
jgi:hypothetical protein